MVAEINHDAREERHEETTQERAYLSVLLNPVQNGICWRHDIQQRQQQKFVVDNCNVERKQKNFDECMYISPQGLVVPGIIMSN